MLIAVAVPAAMTNKRTAPPFNDFRAAAPRNDLVVQVFCVVLDNMAVDIQVPSDIEQLQHHVSLSLYLFCLKLAIIASATVHVIAHGGMSYAMMFASSCSACHFAHILPFCTLLLLCPASCIACHDLFIT